MKDKFFECHRKGWVWMHQCCVFGTGFSDNFPDGLENLTLDELNKQIELFLSVYQNIDDIKKDYPDTYEDMKEELEGLDEEGIRFFLDGVRDWMTLQILREFNDYRQVRLDDLDESE